MRRTIKESSTLALCIVQNHMQDQKFLTDGAVKFGLWTALKHIQKTRFGYKRQELYISFCAKAGRHVSSTVSISPGKHNWVMTAKSAHVDEQDRFLQFKFSN